MRQRQPPFAVLLLSMLAIALLPYISNAKKKKPRRPNPSQQAQRALPKAKQDYSDARRALYQTERALSVALRDARNELDKDRQQLDRTNYAEAAEVNDQAEKHVEFLREQIQAKLLSGNSAYAEARKNLQAAQYEYEVISSSDSPNPTRVLEALKAIKDPSNKVSEIEEKAFAENTHYQKALAHVAETEQRLEDERKALATQINDDQYAPATQANLKAAAAEVSKARLAAAEKAATLNRLLQVLAPSNKVDIGLKINQSKKKPRRGKGKKKK